VTRWTYYSPIPLGAAAALVLHGPLREACPSALAAWPWVFVVIVACATGVAAQLVLIGLQGTAAQVLPVPGGRSIRGRGAVWSGGLLLAAVLSPMAAVFLRTEGMEHLLWVVLGAGLLCAITSLLVYVWHWPAAVRDFAPQR
jgi:hypothetical protein